MKLRFQCSLKSIKAAPGTVQFYPDAILRLFDANCALCCDRSSFRGSAYRLLMTSEAPPNTPETPEPPPPRLPLYFFLAPGSGWFRALRHPEYRFFWTGNFVSNIGSWMQNVAQGWLVFELTHSPFWLGVVGFAQQIPSLLFSLPAGVVADRAPRRQILFYTQTVMMALAALLTALAYFEIVIVEHMVVIAFLAGTIMAFNAPTYQSAIRDLVKEEDTLNAIALNSIQFNLSRVLGPSVAGIMIALASVSACFLVNTISYVPLLFVISRVQFPARAGSGKVSGYRADMEEAMLYVWKHREVLVLILLVAMVSMFGLPYLTMMPAFAHDVLNVGAQGLGLLVASAGLGALLGGLHLAQIKDHQKRGPIVLVAAIVFFTAILSFSLSHSVIFSSLMLAIAGAGMVNCAATVNSLIQTKVPDEIRGRVLSMHTMAFLGFTPLGSLLVGYVAEKSNPSTALALSSGFALLLTIWIAATRRDVRALR